MPHVWWHLYDLYGFDVLYGLVYDIMHILSLCVFKKYVHLLVKYAEEGTVQRRG